MKTWTVVLELQDHGSGAGHGDNEYMTQSQMNRLVSETLTAIEPSYVSFRIMETIEAPYGPQHPNGVFIADSKLRKIAGQS